MKFLNFVVFHIDKLDEIVKVADNIVANPPEGYKNLAQYSCGSNPFPGIELPQGTVVSVSISECETADAILSLNYQLALAGATVHRVPVLEFTPGSVEEEVEKLKA